MFLRQRTPMNAQDHAVFIVRKLLHHLDINYSNFFLKGYFKEHPDFPSLFSVNEYLNKLSISTAVLNIPVENIPEIPPHSLTYLSDYLVGINYFSIIQAVNDREIIYTDHFGEWQTTTLESFREKWEGPTIIMESQPDSGEYQIQQHLKIEKEERFTKQTIYLILILLLVMLPISVADLKTSVFSFIKIGGIAVTGMLLVKEAGLNVSFINRFCTLNGISKNVGCYKVISSDAARLFNVVNMTDLGLIYFSSGLIQLYISSLLNHFYLFSLVQLISCCITLPYTIFSIYYQVKVVKSWCPFCILTQMLFWMEAALFFTTFNAPHLATFQLVKMADVSVWIFSISLPVLAICIFRAYFSNAVRDLPFIKRQLGLFKSSAEAMKVTLMENSQTLSNESFPNDIVLGNPSAGHSITIVLSAYCPFCEHLVNDIKDFISTIKSAKVTLRFTSNNPLNNEFTDYLLAYSAEHSHINTFQCINTWYQLKEKSIEYLNANVLKIASIDYNLIVAGKRNWDGWINQNAIQHTPTIIIDDRIMPGILKIEDFVLYFNQSPITAAVI